MDVQTETKDGVDYIKVIGRVDTTTADQLEHEVIPAAEKSNNMVMDFKDLEYISSAGLRILLDIQKTMNQKDGKFKVININEFVEEVFHMTGFQNVVEVE